jgi:hypothetical protein
MALYMGTKVFSIQCKTGELYLLGETYLGLGKTRLDKTLRDVSPGFAPSTR